MTEFSAGKQFVKDGHVFRFDPEDPEKLYYWDGDNHGGWECIVCHQAWCIYCPGGKPDKIKNEICHKHYRNETLPGLEFATPESEK